MSQSSNKTELNIQSSQPGTMLNSEVSPATELNGGVTGARNDGTVLNRTAGGGLGTDINQSAFGSYIPTGTILCGEYMVESELTDSTGEADILLCTRGRKEFVAKVYRRRTAIKEEVVEAIKVIDSPYVAKTYAVGDWNGFPVEIMEYYKNGSLDGKTFTVEKLRSVIIPNLNEGLKALHDAGIVHKDLKPSNVMFSNDNSHVLILDFGISSVRDDGSTIIRTKTGLTPEYSAPETFRNMFWTGSDYYSLGITIYQLLTGHTPFEGLDSEQTEQMIDLQQIPFPDDFDPEIKALVCGLTYRDIRKRRETDNPNNRWGYEQVKKWLQGIPQIVPGEEHGTAYKFPAFSFNGKEYTTLTPLLDAMGTNWEEGKNTVFRGTLRRHLRKIDRDVADTLQDAEDALDDANDAGTTKSLDTDILFFKTLCNVRPESPIFRWKGKVYADIAALGTRLLTELRRGGDSMNGYIDELLSKNVLSTFAELTAADDEFTSLLKNIEEKHRTEKNPSKEVKIREYYLLGYLLSEDRTMVLDGRTFSDPDDVSEYMLELLNESTAKCEEFSKKLMPDRKKLEPQFEYWLRALDKGSLIDKWQNSSSII